MTFPEVEDDVPSSSSSTDQASVPSPTPEKKKRIRKKKRKIEEAITDIKTGDIDTNDDSMANNKTVYCEGFPFDSNETAVREFFESRNCPVNSLRLPTWQDTGRLRGFGHVVFDSAETATRACSNDVNKQSMGSRYINISRPNVPRQEKDNQKEVRSQPQGCRFVFVKNLPYDADENGVREAFQTFGKIGDHGVRISRNQNSDSKGFGYVEFKEPEFALAAVKQASKPFGLTVSGRPVFVDFEEGKAKMSFRLADGQFLKSQGDEKQKKQHKR